VDRGTRGEAHASDHAPAWIELAKEMPPGKRKTTRSKD
jgi:hypothetical protein